MAHGEVSPSHKVIVTAQMPLEMYEALLAAADEADRSLSGEIRHAVRNHLAAVTSADKVSA